MQDFDIGDYSLTQDSGLPDVDRWDKFVVYMSKILMPYLEYDLSIPFVKNGMIILSVGVVIGVFGYISKISILQYFAYPGVAVFVAFVFSLLIISPLLFISCGISEYMRTKGIPKYLSRFITVFFVLGLYGVFLMLTRL